MSIEIPGVPDFSVLQRYLDNKNDAEAEEEVRKQMLELADDIQATRNILAQLMKDQNRYRHTNPLDEELMEKILTKKQSAEELLVKKDFLVSYNSSRFGEN